MKKFIISIILLVSLSTQSTFPLLEGVKKKIAKSENIKKAKELLNMKENIRCMRKGDNCSKEKRRMLLTVSGLLATLAALGVVGLGKYLVAKKEPSREFQDDIFKKAKNMQTTLMFDTMQQLAVNEGVQLKDVHSEDGYSLIVAVIGSPLGQKKDDKEMKEVIVKLMKAGVRLTEADKRLIMDNALMVWLLEEQAKHT